MLNESLRSLGEYAEVVVDLKKRGVGLADIQAACCGGSVHLIRCREESRLAAIGTERSKDSTSQQRDKLDHNSLQLHNLVYEQQYYDKEIAGCINFQSSVPDDKLSCIGQEQFIRQAGPEVAGLSAHDRELARLTHELQQRKRLKADLQALQQRKQQALADLSIATARIDNLRSHMEAISQSSKQLVETSIPAMSAVKNNKDAAELLPLPLYIVYSQAVAGSNVLDLPLVVDIDGSTAAAARFAAEAAASTADGAAEAAAATAATPSQSGKRRRKSEHQQEDQTYKVHPLSVSLDVYLSNQAGPDHQPLMQLTFQYYTQLQLVCVSASSPEAEEVLTDMFLGDVGDGQLFENVAALASTAGSPPQFGGPGRPRPFRWAQELAGVDVVLSLPSSLAGVDRQQLLSALSAYRSQLRLEAFVERLTAAVEGRRAMKAILERLSRKEQPPSSYDVRVLTKISTGIHNWRHLSDTGMAVKTVEQLRGPGRPSPLHRLQVWQPQAAGSAQEEGEVAGAMGDGDATSHLQHIDTAEEDLLQGLLAEDAAGSAAAGDAAANKAAARSARTVRAAEGGETAAAGVSALYDEGLEQGFEEEGYLHLSEASEASDAAAVDDAATADLAGGSSGSSSVCAVMARYSLFRLVLRSPNMEAHFHVKVFLNYPLCPPVFAVTKLLDTKSKSVGPLQAVNEVLALEHQVNSAAVTAATDASEVLAVQVLQLRQYMDLLSSQLRSDASSKDLVDKLRAKQQLRGRDRQPRLLACSRG